MAFYRKRDAHGRFSSTGAGGSKVKKVAGRGNRNLLNRVKDHKLASFGSYSKVAGRMSRGATSNDAHRRVEKARSKRDKIPW